MYVRILLLSCNNCACYVIPLQYYSQNFKKQNIKKIKVCPIQDRNEKTKRMKNCFLLPKDTNEKFVKF